LIVAQGVVDWTGRKSLIARLGVNEVDSRPRGCRLDGTEISYSNPRKGRLGVAELPPGSAALADTAARTGLEQPRLESGQSVADWTVEMMTAAIGKDKWWQPVSFYVWRLVSNFIFTRCLFIQ